MPIHTILADAALDFSTVWSAFTTAWSSVVTFIAGQNILLTIIGIPLGVGLVGIVMKIFR